MPPDPRPTSRGSDRDRARSLTELLRSVASDAAQLVRQEIALARAEVRRTLSGVAGAAARLAVGAGLGSVGGLVVLVAVIILLGGLLGSYWLSALIVGALLLLGGGLIAFGGIRRLRAIDPTPRATLESVQATAQWARNEVAEVKATLRGQRSRAGLPAAGKPAAGLSAPGGLLPERAVPAGRSAVVVRPSGSASVAETGGATPAASRPAAARAQREPPPRSAGWWPFLKHVGKEIQEDQITGHAAKLAYYAFMAMPPALMALFGLAGLIGSEQLAAWLQEQSALALPTAVSEGIIGPFIEQVVLEKAPGPFSIGLLLALWGGSSVFMGLIDTLNHAYDIEESRSFVKKRGLAVGTMIGGVLLFVGAAGALLVAPALVDALGLGSAGTFVWNLLQWPVAFLFMVAAFWCAYYILPNRDQSGCKVLLIKAAALAAALWVLATAGFRLYIANFSSYSETYGFLGAFIILLLWLYVTGLVVLAGGELASEMERRAP